jgi:elongation factor P
MTFMDSESFEQFTMPNDTLGDTIGFLQDGMVVEVDFVEGSPVSITLPEKVVMKVVEADPVVKGQTASSSYKPAKLENGMKILVPPFLEEGEVIWVNTTDCTYVERFKG